MNYKEKIGNIAGCKSTNLPSTSQPIFDMHSTRASHHQQNRIKNFQSKCHSDQLFNLLTSDTLLSKVEELLPTHRERRYPPTETLSMFLTQGMNADRSCQFIVNQGAVRRLACGLSSTNTYTAEGYCRARQRLPLEMVTSLTAFVGQSIGHQMPSDWRWQNRRVRIVDGTTVTMPDTPANLTAFPQQRWQVELDIRNIKQTMGMDKLSCKTPDMAVKEIWVYCWLIT